MSLRRERMHAMKWIGLRLLFPVVAGLLFAGCGSLPRATDGPALESATSFGEPVAFADSHDFFTVELVGGRQLEVVYGRPDGDSVWLTEAEVEKWKSGRALLLRYTEKVGLELLDPASGRGLPVTRESGNAEGGAQRQPLDRWLEARMAETQIELQEFSDLAIRLWRSEVARLHKLATGRFGHLLTPGERKELQEEAAMWSRFQESQARADRTILKLPSGTRWPLEASQANLQVTRAYALSWAQRLEVLQTAEWERDAEAGPTKRP